MTAKNKIVIRKKTLNTEGGYYDIHVLAELANVSVRTVLKYWRYNLIAPDINTGRYGIYFSDETVYQLRRLEHLSGKLGINMKGIQLIDALSAEVERLKQELDFHRR